MLKVVQLYSYNTSRKKRVHSQNITLNREWSRLCDPHSVIHISYDEQVSFSTEI